MKITWNVVMVVIKAVMWVGKQLFGSGSNSSKGGDK